MAPGAPRRRPTPGWGIVERTGARVDLRHAELEIHVEVLPAETFVYVNRVAGPGGLPVGASGTVVALLSGGIDSPVAAWRMMRRGCRATLVHFHGAPFHSRASQDKARQMVALLCRYQLSARLHLVAFGEVY